MTASDKATSEDGAIFNVLPAYEHILSQLETAKVIYSNYPHLSICVNLAWSKMDEYYKATDLSCAYLVASILDPRLKMQYFEKNNWKRDWLKGAREKCCLHSDRFILAMGIDSHSVENESRQNNQESSASFGSWRKFDDDKDDI